MIVFPGGFGTLDELSEMLTLNQTERSLHMPVVPFGADFWPRLIDFNVLAELGLVAPKDIELFRTVDPLDRPAWAVKYGALHAPAMSPNAGPCPCGERAQCVFEAHAVWVW